MEIVDAQTIRLDRELSELDNLVFDFLEILKRHTDYVLVSGYVAILLGRSRTTEDVDLFIPKLSREQFSLFYRDLLEQGYWAINADAEAELFSLLEDKIPIRFAERGKTIPNFEIKFVRDYLDQATLQKKVRIITKRGDLFISDLELQVAYKKLVLKSEKDIEDAQHLQSTFKISEQNINKYKPLFQQYGRLD